MKNSEVQYNTVKDSEVRYRLKAVQSRAVQCRIVQWMAVQDKQSRAVGQSVIVCNVQCPVFRLLVEALSMMTWQGWGIVSSEAKTRSYGPLRWPVFTFWEGLGPLVETFFVPFPNEFWLFSDSDSGLKSGSAEEWWIQEVTHLTDTLATAIQYQRRFGEWTDIPTGKWKDSLDSTIGLLGEHNHSSR